MYRLILPPLLALVLGAACATTPPVNPGGPAGARRNEFAYPARLTDSKDRKDAAIAAWAQLAPQPGSAAALTLQPITETIRKLPDNLSSPLYLPRVGTGSVMNEEETRESLRRFLRAAQKLIGADPAQLSLAEESKDSGGMNLAVYEQRPFNYPLRGAYGRIEIRFADDRRITGLSSTAIPDTDKIQTALSASIPLLKAEDVTTRLGGRSVTYLDAAGQQRSYVIGSAARIEIRQLVVYPILSPAGTGALEFHLAWEIDLPEAPVKTIYYDSLSDQIINP